MDDVEMKIDIPTDDDGFILLQCKHCGNFFKVKPSDMKDDGVLDIFCPSCGLVSDNYLTEDVYELASNMIENRALSVLHDKLKDLERLSKNSMVSIKVSNMPNEKSENKIWSKVSDLEIAAFPCCKRTAKIKPLLKMTGAYCPFCGVKYYGNE